MQIPEVGEMPPVADSDSKVHKADATILVVRLDIYEHQCTFSALLVSSPFSTSSTLITSALKRMFIQLVAHCRRHFSLAHTLGRQVAE